MMWYQLRRSRSFDLPRWSLTRPRGSHFRSRGRAPRRRGATCLRRGLVAPAAPKLGVAQRHRHRPACAIAPPLGLLLLAQTILGSARCGVTPLPSGFVLRRDLDPAEDPRLARAEAEPLYLEVETLRHRAARAAVPDPEAEDRPIAGTAGVPLREHEHLAASCIRGRIKILFI